MTMKLQTIHHSDGSCEILRKLSLDWLAQCQDDDLLLYESSIVWLEDISKLPYVRVMTATKCRSRRGPMRQGNGGRIVGYSTLHADAPSDRDSGTFTRRVFYLRESDSRALRVGLHRLPSDAVDPRTIFPGALGVPPTEASRPASEHSLRHEAERAVPASTPRRRRGDSVVLDWLGVPQGGPPPLPPAGRMTRFV
jgi:hypothetical protein